jgi:hypothetical protein
MPGEICTSQQLKSLSDVINGYFETYNVMKVPL